MGLEGGAANGQTGRASRQQGCLRGGAGRQLRRSFRACSGVYAGFAHHHKVPLVHAGMAAVLPHVGVDGGIGVHERLGEPLLPLAPVDIEELDEEGRDDVAHVVGDPPRLPELRHGRVHERVARARSAPRVKGPRPVVPPLLVVVRAEAPLGQRGEAPERPVGEVPPREASQEGRRGALAELLLHPVEYRARRQLPKAEIRRDHGRAALVGAMALPPLETTHGVREKGLERRLCTRLAGGPKASDAARPVDGLPVGTPGHSRESKGGERQR